jgi:hypothetical protein
MTETGAGSGAGGPRRNQALRGITVTGSPTFYVSTPGPVSAMRPDVSWAENSGHAHALIHVPVQDVEVGPADAGVGHVSPDLSRPWGL